MLEELLQTLEDAASAAGFVSAMIETISKAVSKVGTFRHSLLHCSNLSIIFHYITTNFSLLEINTFVVLTFKNYFLNAKTFHKQKSSCSFCLSYKIILMSFFNINAGNQMMLVM